MEETIIERILLNLGGDAPEILIVFLLVRYVWPGVQELLEKYLARTPAPAAQTFVPQTVTIVLDDSVREVMSGLVAILGVVGAPSATPPVVSPPRTADAGAASGGGAARSSYTGKVPKPGEA